MQLKNQLLVSTQNIPMNIQTHMLITTLVDHLYLLFWAHIYNYLKVPPFNRVQDGTEVTYHKFTLI